MAYVARQTDFQAPAEPYRPTAGVSEPPRRGLLRRFFDAIMEGRQRRAQRDIEHILAHHSRTLTDAFEREMGARMFGGDWNTRR
jgi:hypothetical protein